MPQKSPQHLPDTDIIRAIREVLNNNADLLITGQSVSAEGIITLQTSDPDNNITIDLRGVFKLPTDDAEAGVDPATELTAGKIRIATDSEAAHGTDDTTALSPRKGLALIQAELNDLGLTGGGNNPGNGAGTHSLDAVLTVGNSSAKSLIVGKVYATSPTAAGASEAVLPAVWNPITHEFEKTTAALLAAVVQPFLTTTTVPVVPLIINVDNYNSATGVLTMKSTGGGTDTVQYRIPNLTDWQNSPVFTLPDNQRDGSVTFTIEGRAGSRTNSVNFTPYLPTLSAWLGGVSVTTDFNSHGFIVFAEGTNCPNGVNLSITRSDGVAQYGTSNGENWQTGVARKMLGNNDAKWKLDELFFGGTAGPGLTPGYNYLLLFTNLATQETKTYSTYFSTTTNVDHQTVQQVISDPTNPVTPTDPVTPTPGNPYDYTYSIVETGIDSEGVAFTNQTAPVYAEVVPDHPTPVQNRYPFAQQIAKGVASFKRFPPFTVSRVRTHLWGPWYSVASANLHFSRGITAVNAWANFRSGPTNLAALPAERKIFMYDDANCRAYAQILLNENGSSANAGVWSAFGNGHQYSDPSNANTEPAFRAIGARIWQGDKGGLDTAGRGIKYVSFDLESTDNFQFERSCIGWMYLGYLTAANADGLFPVVVLYGQFQFMANVYSGSLKQLATGYPEYLNAGTSFDLFPAVDPTFQAVIQSGGSLTVDGYMQGIHGYEDILVRDSSHNPVLSNGAIQYTAAASTVLYGQTVPLQGATPAINDNPAFPSEAARLVSDLRRHAARLYIQWHWMAGGYPETSDQRRAGFAGAHVGAAIRLDNEGVLGMIYNDRPLPQWQLEVVTQLNSWHAIDGDNINWASCFNVPPTTPGNHPATANNYPYDAGGPVEAVEKGLHRFSQFNSIRVGNCRFGWPNLDIVSSNTIDGERPEQKPIIKLEFWGTGDNQVMIILIIWEMLDSTSRDFTIWFEQDGGYKSLAYTATVSDGREGYCQAAFKLPAGRPDFLGKHARIQFTDILGVKRTITGDYRVQVSGNPAPPAAFAPGTTTPTTPTTPVFSVSGTYNRNTHKLNMAGANAVSGITYNIIGITEGFAVQPADGFDVPPSLRDGTQTLTIAAKTATQNAQTTIAIPADTVSVSNPAYVNLPRIGIGLYNQSPNPRQYGNNPVEDRSAYEYYGINQIANNDGPILAYMPLFRAIAASHSATDKLGYYTLALWSHFKCGTSTDSVWVRGNLSAPFERLMQHQFAEALAHNESIILALNVARESGFREYIADSDRAVDHAGRVSDYPQLSPAPWQFARLLGQNVNSIDTSTSAGKCLQDWKDFLHNRKGDQASGALCAVMPGLNDNGEYGYATGTDPSQRWFDWSAPELSDLRAYLQTLYSSIGALNSAWGTGYGSWNDVTLNFSGDFGDFKGQRGLDCTAFRTKRLGDIAEVYARLIWSELPGLVIVYNFGQSEGGQGGIIGTIDPIYVLRRVQAVAAELGYTFPCVSFKMNPSPNDDYQARGRFAAYVNDAACGYALPMMELSYEVSSGLPDYVGTSDRFRDFLRYANTGRAGDCSTVFAVLFNGNSWNANGGVGSMFGRLFTLPNRLTAPFGFKVAAAAKTITTTALTMLTNMGSGQYPWFQTLINNWLGMNGQNEDVQLVFPGLGLPAVITQPQPTGCIPMTGGTLGQDSTVTQNSELVVSFDELAGDTSTLQFTWIETNGAVVVQGGGPNDFAIRLRFPNVGESVVTCKAQNACGSVTRSVKVTVPAPPDNSLVQPYFDVSVDQPVLQGNGTYSQAVIHLTGLKNATRYKIFVGDVTDNAQDFFTDVTGTSASFTEPAPASGVSKKYSVRFWNGTDTAHWADRSFTITSPVQIVTVTQVDYEQVAGVSGQENENIYVKLSVGGERVQFRGKAKTSGGTYQDYTNWFTADAYSTGGFNGLIQSVNTAGTEYTYQFRPFSNQTDGATVTVVLPASTGNVARTTKYPLSS